MTNKEYKRAKQEGLNIYNRAKKNNLTNIKRWEEGIDHHPKSIELMKFLKEHDFHDNDDSFEWKVGGDGDNGENLMFEMDVYFEQKDKDEDINLKSIDIDINFPEL